MGGAYQGNANVLGTHFSLVGVIVLSPNLNHSKGRLYSPSLDTLQTSHKWDGHDAPHANCS
jgi:hypothetical protein